MNGIDEIYLLSEDFFGIYNEINLNSLDLRNRILLSIKGQSFSPFSQKAETEQFSTK